MPNALIVDDSKTARYALRQLLDKQQIASDMVESAEQALEYLRERRPDLIFMDHMMPGMDGFEAVKLIKADPATRAIPIVMYTSTQGGVYFGQARALGAEDVIAKPATSQELQDVLRRLDERRRRTARTDEAASAATATVEIDEATATESAVAAAPTAEIPPPQVPLEYNEHVGTLAARSTAPVGGRRSWWLALGAIAAALMFAALYLDARAEQQILLRQHQAALEALRWAVGDAHEYPYGEVPFGGERLVRLQELLVHLRAVGFRGRVVIESHVGEFCLIRGEGAGAETWIPAQGDMPITDCGALGQSDERSRRMGREQTNAFERFLERSPLLADGSIRVELVPRGADEPAESYPASAAVSADVWNAIARRNNRVTFELMPASKRF